MTEEELLRARRAKVVLAEGVVKEAFEELEQYYTEMWKVSKSPEEREDLWRKIDAIDKLYANLQAWAEAPEIEERSERRKALQSRN